MIDSSARTHAQDLLDFVDASPSPWHAADNLAKRFEAAGFQCLDEQQPWAIESGQSYYVIRDDSSLIAFRCGTDLPSQNGFRIIGAHTDSPGLRIKPNPETSSGGYQRLGVEIYGGPILATFTDRDLSLAGRVCLKQNLQRSDRLVHFADPLLRLPNLAIHMNRTVNEDGLKLHKQQELPLIFAGSPAGEKGDSRFLNLLADTLAVEPEAILSWDLAIFDTQPGAFFGLEQEFLADSQLDNLASCHAATTALIQSPKQGNGIQIAAFFDHEEVGSVSAKGADGSFLQDVLDRIQHALEPNADAAKQARAKSFQISADMAHAFQPNFPGAYEPDHHVLVNHGPVIKRNANQRYASESSSEARFIELCQQADVPYQHYTHRNDLPCGSTIGPMSSARLGIQTVDVGNPMWAMHSIRESAGVLDHDYLTRVFGLFYS